MKKLLLASALIAATSASQAEVGLNGGFVTDYVYRGSTLGDAGAYASVEYSNAGFTVGVWGIQDGNSTNGGLEYDVYGSYGLDVNDDLSLSLGYTQYNYSYEAPGVSEAEVNLGVAYGPVALDVAIGEDRNGEDDAADYDFTYVALSGSISNIGLLVGSYDADASDDGSNTDEGSDYVHYEVSTGAELESIGASLGLVLGHNEPKEDNAAGTQYIYLDLSKDFEF